MALTSSALAESVPQLLRRPTGLHTQPTWRFTNASSTTPNHTIGADECFASWLNFASASQLETEGIGSFLSSAVFTTTNTGDGSPGYTTTEVQTLDETDTMYDGGFPIETLTIHTTESSTYSFVDEPGWTQTITYTEEVDTTFYPKNTLPKPTCTLASYIPACQRQWETYISSQLVPEPTPPPGCDLAAGILNTRTTPVCASSYLSIMDAFDSSLSSNVLPACTQASIGGELCQSARDAWVYSDFGGGFVPTPTDVGYWPFTSAGFFGRYKDFDNGDREITWSWPTTGTLVPSCTLGCGRCAVTGGTVQLLYWPATPTLTGSANAMATTTGPVVAIVEGTTLTSPTMYISYGDVYASNGCRKVGTSITNTIVAIPTDSPLSSIYATPVPCGPHEMAFPTEVVFGTASFNVTDLNEPVPYSIYTSQPFCASMQFCSSLPDGSPPPCPTDQPYKPLLVVPEPVLRSLQPDWADCKGDLRGVYDPPSALSRATHVDRPTIPHGPSRPSATITPGAPVSLLNVPQETAPATALQDSLSSSAAPHLSSSTGPSATAYATNLGDPGTQPTDSPAKSYSQDSSDPSLQSIVGSHGTYAGQPSGSSTDPMTNNASNVRLAVLMIATASVFLLIKIL